MLLQVPLSLVQTFSLLFSPLCHFFHFFLGDHALSPMPLFSPFYNRFLFGVNVLSLLPSFFFLWPSLSLSLHGPGLSLPMLLISPFCHHSLPYSITPSSFFSFIPWFLTFYHCVFPSAITVSPLLNLFP